MSASHTPSEKLSLFGSLYAKLASILVVILLTMGFVYGFITFSVTHDYLQEITQEFNRDLAKNLVGERDIVVNGKINTQALKQTFHDYMTVNPNIEIYLLDLQGNILSYSADPGKVQRETVALEAIDAFFQGKLLPGDDPRSFTIKKAFSVTYVPTKENPEGYLYVVLRGEKFDQVNQALQDNYFIQYSLLSLSISLSIGLLLGLLLFYTITRRVRNLSVAMSNFTKNGFSSYPEPKLVDKQYNDEIGQLASSFDVMAEHTIVQMGKLEEQDKLRRDLIANISHDLRTPLASMLGYLEILTLKEDSLDSDDRKKYLKTVSQNGKRLNRLIDNLFELAKFDAREIVPELEVFNFSEFIYDVAQKFQNKAEQADISLALQCSQEALLVNADIALIERVLDNLLVNAFNHTIAGGTINIIVSPLIKDEHSDNQLQIQIKDNGSGISESDLPKIFDRFHQAQNKHHRGKHAGLGLAIVKQIVVLHKQQIHVQSKLGEGTQFTFTLPLESTDKD
ncbi:MAG: HAMP domain-containing protein [gamma proteobacterium symbiont of Bathyaustriella thionipta]|nr:HAMP domain-containing protein [gamma proteobacterium symbiont of Bathyaustriella thionipta]MCU7948664.1 HAMP domain-containing protein [gamma proteobacterium symbiont of Bathyaustriella thionipta]MCU7953698.1 HAMP domain-containing protein [gamma proteobacterium symbiont of Bathyaustriella thionipta]MCU7955195.1 HAMP domain-containing protein [gamma proteobacterium symbiont of Bathyaustriella thionipta]MCU7967090.1 HAMP domain-containing protein [gamma proteobacterium symbiont of Bathyaustr